MNSDLYQTLEFDRVLKDLARRALSSLAAERIRGLSPLSDIELVRKSLGRISELCSLMDSGGVFPIGRFEDITGHLEIAAVDGSYLEPKAFRDIHQILEIAARVNRFFLKNRPDFPLLQEISRGLLPDPQFSEEMSRCIDLKTLDIRDQASADLATIRRTKGRVLEQLRKELDRLLDRLWRQGILQERLVTIRQGRWVLPVKETHRHRIQGVFHDQSASGATLFVEPLQILELNNKVRQLESQERQEVEKILRRLTDLVRVRRTSLEENLEVLVTLDAIHAMALTARALKQHAPALSSRPLLKIKQGRHPLLVLRKDQDAAVVPLDLSLGEDFNTFVITGPNAGGKTVALKTVGLLALMVSCGLHIPASPDSQMPVFKRIFAHVGDAQSIEMNLSTFSAHIQGIKRIVDEATDGDLVLIDEIGTGTDPQEGAALAMATLECLTNRNVLTIVTTHQGSLKAFAHETPGMANGSMAFDSQTLTPTYRFHPHLPGSSYGLEIASRIGLADSIITRSRILMGRQAHRLEDLISGLHEQTRHNEQLEEELRAEKLLLEKLTKHYQEENDRLLTETNTIRRKAVEEAGSIMKRANAAVESAVRIIREKRAGREAIREARTLIKEEKKRLTEEGKPFLRNQRHGSEDQLTGAVQAGDRVLWKRAGGMAATVVSGEDSTGQILVAVGNLKLRVPRAELARAKGPDKIAGHAHSRIAFPSPEDVRTEVDVRGMTVEEALEAVDKRVNDALLAGLGEIQIIHGMGTGALRKGVIPFLEQHPLVTEIFPGGAQRHNFGVTVARIGGK